MVKISNFFVDNESKLFKIIFQLLHICLGHDFGYFEHKSKKVTFLIKLVCFVQSFVISALLLIYMVSIIDNLGINHVIWHAYYIVKYFTFILIILLKCNKTVREIQLILIRLDLALKSVDANKYVAKRLYFTILIIAMYKVAVFLSYTSRHGNFLPLYLWIVYTAIVLSTEFVNIIYMFSLYSFYYRISIILQNIKSNRYTCNGVSYEYYQFMYKLIADSCEKLKRLFDPIFLVFISLCVPRIMYTIYSVIREQHDKHTTKISFEHFSPLLTLFIVLGPAFSAGKITSEVMKLKKVLHDILVFETDNFKSVKLERFIRYVEARPLRFTVYQVIPLNENLLGIITHFCVTYLIVIIQLTHLY